MIHLGSTLQITVLATLTLFCVCKNVCSSGNQSGPSGCCHIFDFGKLPLVQHFPQQFECVKRFGLEEKHLNGTVIRIPLSSDLDKEKMRSSIEDKLGKSLETRLVFAKTLNSLSICHCRMPANCSEKSTFEKRIPEVVAYAEIKKSKDSMACMGLLCVFVEVLLSSGCRMLSESNVEDEKSEPPVCIHRQISVLEIRIDKNQVFAPMKPEDEKRQTDEKETNSFSRRWLVVTSQVSESQMELLKRQVCHYKDFVQMMPSIQVNSESVLNPNMQLAAEMSPQRRSSRCHLHVDGTAITSTGHSKSLVLHIWLLAFRVQC